jgi:hypothetical protein
MYKIYTRNSHLQKQNLRHSLSEMSKKLGFGLSYILILSINYILSNLSYSLSYRTSISFHIPTSVQKTYTISDLNCIILDVVRQTKCILFLTYIIILYDYDLAAVKFLTLYFGKVQLRPTSKSVGKLGSYLL